MDSPPAGSSSSTRSPVRWRETPPQARWSSSRATRVRTYVRTYMLAQMVKEIHAPRPCGWGGDVGVVWGWLVAGGDDEDDEMVGSVHRSADGRC